MSGFDAARADAAFFAGTAIKTNFLCNLGYGDPAGVFARSPRLLFDKACRMSDRMHRIRHQVISRARPNATAAASPPTVSVWNAERNAPVPVKRPFA